MVESYLIFSIYNIVSHGGNTNTNDRYEIERVSSGLDYAASNGMAVRLCSMHCISEVICS